METKPSSKIPLFFPIIFLLLSTLTQPSLSSSIDTIIINGKDPSISLRRRILLASQRNNKMNQIPNCGEMVSRSQCLQNPKCRWCRSEALDDMCFKKTEAWRLPQQKLATMNEICSGDENHVVLNVYDEPDSHNHPPSAKNKDSEMVFSIPFMQKVMGEVLGTYFLIFAGCAAVVVNTNNDKVLTNPGIAIVWGLAVMVLVYSLRHISGAHFNPAVTIAFATCKTFPLKQVPFYISAQVVGSTMAAGTLRLLFNGPDDVFSGTTPQGSDLQAFVIEFIITFYLMFVVSGVATDNRAIGELAGLAIGFTVLLNVLIAGPITGASMNPARSLGPAIVSNHYEGIWIYVTSPIIGAVSGAWVYNMMRLNDKRDITKNVSIFKS